MATFEGGKYEPNIGSATAQRYADLNRSPMQLGEGGLLTVTTNFHVLSNKVRQAGLKLNRLYSSNMTKLGQQIADQAMIVFRQATESAVGSGRLSGSTEAFAIPSGELGQSVITVHQWARNKAGYAYYAPFVIWGHHTRPVTQPRASTIGQHFIDGKHYDIDAMAILTPLIEAEMGALIDEMLVETGNELFTTAGSEERI